MVTVPGVRLPVPPRPPTPVPTPQGEDLWKRMLSTDAGKRALAFLADYGPPDHAPPTEDGSVAPRGTWAARETLGWQQAEAQAMKGEVKVHFPPGARQSVNIEDRRSWVEPAPVAAPGLLFGQSGGVSPRAPAGRIRCRARQEGRAAEDGREPGELISTRSRAACRTLRLRTAPRRRVILAQSYSRSSATLGPSAC